MKGVYYNEFDPQAAEWLRELMKADLIPKGVVDERSIRDVEAKELADFTTVHLFAGIGGWPRALRLAGWPDDRPVWTGSCPCQPYSAAGKGEGDNDPRNLWPHMFRLVRECRPVVCFGEQVEGAVKHGWLDRVSADLEGEGYAVGSVVLGAHSVGSPHIRQRLFWVADTTSERRPQHKRRKGKREEPDAEDLCESGGLAHTGPVERFGRKGQQQPAGESAEERDEEGAVDQRGGSTRGVALANGRKSGNRKLQRGGQHGQRTADSRACIGVEHTAGNGRKQGRPESNGRYADAARSLGGLDDAPGERAEYGRQDEPGGNRTDDGVPRPTGHWADFDLIPCRDGKARRVEPGTFPLVDGLPGRVGLLRGYGNAIVPQVAAEFIRAWQEVRGEL